MSGLQANVWADLITWAITTLPVIAIHHVLMKRHITRVTSQQTQVIKKVTDQQTKAIKGEPG